MTVVFGQHRSLTSLSWLYGNHDNRFFLKTRCVHPDWGLVVIVRVQRKSSQRQKPKDGCVSSPKYGVLFIAVLLVLFAKYRVRHFLCTSSLIMFTPAVLTHPEPNKLRYLNKDGLKVCFYFFYFCVGVVFHCTADTRVTIFTRTSHRGAVEINPRVSDQFWFKMNRSDIFFLTIKTLQHI